MLLAAFSFALSAGLPIGLLPAASAPIAVTVRAGGVVSLSVRYMAPAVLVNRAAPNSLLLVTPWQKAQAGLRGPARTEPQWADYFAGVEPVLFKMRVPARAKAGQYPASVTAQLFVCDQHEKVCRLQELTLPVTLKVSLAGAKQAALTLNIRSQELRRSPLD
ncbi:hypothetical protein [Deinococcus sp.]|uniref:hypothetical protein n=1 Tax=Deinococcus sp. TaxID=47478 RepID=UPI0025BFD1CF|nr:hypothetical protein [Deinococcus sp.]